MLVYEDKRLIVNGLQCHYELSYFFMQMTIKRAVPLYKIIFDYLKIHHLLRECSYLTLALY
jgi:hypothetical protein